MFWMCSTVLELLSAPFSYEVHTPQRAHPARGHRLSMGVATLHTRNPKHTDLCVCAQLELTGKPECSKWLKSFKSKVFLLSCSHRLMSSPPSHETPRAELTAQLLADPTASTAQGPHSPEAYGCFKSPLHYWSTKEDKDASPDIVHCEEIMLKRCSFNPLMEFST